jgi:DNA-binding MarR family transcriptional regulator
MDRMDIMSLIAVGHLTWKRHLQAGTLAAGITLKQCYLLRQLTRRPYLHPAEIARMLFCDRPTASIVIRNMQRQGWIARERDPGDARQARITIAAAGRRKLKAVEASAAVMGRGRFDPLACFSQAERTTLEALLRRLWAHLAPLRGDADNDERENP